MTEKKKREKDKKVIPDPIDDRKSIDDRDVGILGYLMND